MKEQNDPKEINRRNSRLDNPLWRLISTLIAFSAIGILLYSIVAGYETIPFLTAIFFLMLSFLPQIWTWIEFVFSKRPSNKWWRLALNLVLAILMASMFEDVFEIVIRFLLFIYEAAVRL